MIDEAPDLDRSEDIDDSPFTRSFGESLDHLLDLDSWSPGVDLAQTYARIEREVKDAVEQGERTRSKIRGEVFEALSADTSSVADRGVYKATPAQLERVQTGLLFRGAVEACDGISLVHDSLPLTIMQIGVCLVTYQGDQGSWAHRMFQRDLRGQSGDLMQELLELLERRRQRGGLDNESSRDQMSSLARRGIMAWAERAALTQKSSAQWLMGQGNPAPYEMLTGAGMVEPATGDGSSYPLLAASLSVLGRLLKHRKFVFVPSKTTDRVALTIGHALRPLEYAILDNISGQLDRLYADRQGHYGLAERRMIQDFAEAAGPQIIKGVYRATNLGPPQVFYAHRDHAHEAALIALADSVIQEHRTFPTLLELADVVCKTTFGVDSFAPSVRIAYADAGQPWSFESERSTRR